MLLFKKIHGSVFARQFRRLRSACGPVGCVGATVTAETVAGARMAARPSPRPHGWDKRKLQKYSLNTPRRPGLSPDPHSPPLLHRRPLSLNIAVSIPMLHCHLEGQPVNEKSSHVSMASRDGRSSHPGPGACTWGRCAFVATQEARSNAFNGLCGTSRARTTIPQPGGLSPSG